jgi:hypothetical protein
MWSDYWVPEGSEKSRYVKDGRECLIAFIYT